MNKIHNIVIGAGGARAVAAKTGLTEDAVRKWWGANSYGIPDRYWSDLRSLTPGLRSMDVHFAYRMYAANREDRT